MSATPPSVGKVLAYLFGGLAVLFIAWVISGGPAKYEAKNDKFIKQLSPYEEAQTYDEKIFRTRK